MLLTEISKLYFLNIIYTIQLHIFKDIAAK